MHTDDLSFRKRLRMAARADRVDLLIRRMQDDVAAALGILADDVDVNQGLFSLGLSSLLALQLKQRLEALVGTELSDTTIFNHPCIQDLADYLSGRLDGAETKSGPTDGDALDAEEDELLDRLERKLGRRS